MPFKLFDIAADQINEIEESSLFDGHGTIHIRFTGRESWIDEKTSLRRVIMKPNRDARFRAIPEFMCIAAGVEQDKIALIDNRAEKPCQKHRFPRVVNKFTTLTETLAKLCPTGKTHIYG